MKKQLTKAEEEVMQILWEQEPAAVSDLLPHFHNKEPAHSTVSTIIRILEEKGFVQHKTYGRTHVYFARVSKEEYSQSSIQQLIGKYFEGSPEKLVSFMVRKKEVDIEAVEELIRAIKNP